MRKNTGLMLFLMGSLIFSLACLCGDDEASETTSEWKVEGNDAPKPERGERAAPAPKPAQDEAAEVLSGSAFNKAFPDDGFQQTKRTFTQEKDGFSEAIYALDGQEVVKIAITDTNNNPSARDKFSAATEEIGGAPTMTRGKNASLLLVSDRFQVQVASKTLSPEERATWLGAVKINALP